MSLPHTTHCILFSSLLFKSYLPCEDRLAVRNEHDPPASLLGQCRDDLAQGQQRLVNAHAFLGTRSNILIKPAPEQIYLTKYISSLIAPWKKSYDQPKQHIKKQRHYFANKGPSSQTYGFSSSQVWMWELDHKESWCIWTVVLEKTLESPLDCKEIQPVHPKGNQSWIVIGRTDVEAEAPTLWPPDVKNWLTGRPWFWERLKAGGEGDNRGWDGWMASPTRWTCVSVNSGSCWCTGKPGVLQSMASQRVGHDWATELNWKLLSKYFLSESTHSLWTQSLLSLKSNYNQELWVPFWASDHSLWSAGSERGVFG